MKKILILIAALAFIACGKKPANEAAPAQATAQAGAPNGEALYNDKACATCHGAQGHGDGPVGAALKPKPRNFADAKWKFGTDLKSVIHTIENGSPGTGMAP
ncbi:MAG TPA: c-type cytochrome, partial [Turneriella sp.]|nr:c-type cytochrome [Turneriella sp.]